MRVEYNPKLNKDFSAIVGRAVAFAALLPDDHTMDKKWEWMMSVHGIGERSAGTQEHLENLVLGQKQSDGSRKWPYITDDMKRAVDLYKIVIIVPTYESNAFFDANRTDWVYKQAVQQYSLANEYWYDGFSYGGGAAINASTSILTAPNIAFCTPCAPTRSIGNAALVAQHKTIVHIFVNDNDDNGSTNLNVTKAIISEINKHNPVIPALYTAFNRNGHGGHNEALTIEPPKAPGGQGITDAAENLFTMYLDIRKNGPRQMKSGTSAPMPTPPPLPEVPGQLSAALNLTDGQVITTTSFEMDASGSTGVKPDWDGYRWDVKPISPTSSKMWGVQPEGAYGGPKKKLNNIVDGNYQVTLTVKNKDGQSASRTVKVIAKTGAAPEKKPISFEGTGQVKYSDQSTETITITFVDGKLVVKNSSGQVINL